MNKALFLDRDGIIDEMAYDAEFGTIDQPTNVDQVRLLFGAVDVIKQAKKLGYKTIIISNQPGIALGKMTEAGFAKIRTKIDELLAQEGAKIDAEYYCFHHPFAKVEKYKVTCECRKPKPGLLLQATNEHNIDLKQSYMLGDGVNDILAGHAAGVKTILLGNLLEAEYLRVLEKNLNGVKPDFIIKKLPEVNSILQEGKL